MLKGLSMDSTVEYVSDLDPAKGTDRESDDGTTFTLGTICSRVQTQIRDSVTSFKQDKEATTDASDPQMEAKFRPNEAVYMTCQFGLRGWKRFMDNDGNEIPFKTVARQLAGQTHHVASPESLDRLGLELMRELAENIDKLNEPTEVELGN